MDEASMLRNQRVVGALRATWAQSSRRGLAIAPSVKTATDTSDQEFAAPSHVSLASEAASLAKQFREFYSDPGKNCAVSDFGLPLRGSYGHWNANLRTSCGGVAYRTMRVA